MTSRPLDILILSRFDGGNANVIRDYLFAFNAYSRHRCFYVFDLRTVEPATVRRFDVILVFWSVYLLNHDLAPEVIDAIAASPAVKVLFLQDEYREVRRMNEQMRALGIQHMFSCVDPADHDTFYPRSEIPSLEAVHEVLTGYVPEYLGRHPFEPDRPRPIDIGYRSRDLPWHYGDLSRDKVRIAERFRRIGREHGFSCDISVREEDRIYGQAWVRFTQDCRFSIGTPSGASVIDFTGDIQRRTDAFRAANPDATYEAVRAACFADVDGNVVIETVSPRVFEAAALGSVMVMQAGRYAGVIEPDRHFIEIARDDGNVDEVVAKMRDEGLCRDLARRAYEEIVRSGRYSYRSFIARFDGIIDEAVGATAGAASAPRRSRLAWTMQRYWRAGQHLVPWRQRFLPLPTPVRSAQALLWRLAGRTGTPPEAPLGKALRGLGFCLAQPRLRAAVGRGLRRGAPVPAAALLADAYRLAVLQGTVSGRLATPRPFHVVPRLDARRRLVLESAPGPAGAATAGAVAGVLDDVRRRGARAFAWDHGRVGDEIHFETRWGRRLTLYIGGAIRFDAINGVAASEPGLLADILRRVMASGDAVAGAR